MNGGVAPVPPQENFLKEVFLTFKNFERPETLFRAEKGISKAFLPLARRKGFSF
jgi:hypothetical protein